VTLLAGRSLIVPVGNLGRNALHGSNFALTDFYLNEVVSIAPARFVPMTLCYESRRSLGELPRGQKLFDHFVYN
jgi:hypothetical protein